MAGFDLWLEQPNTGHLSVATNVVSIACDLSKLGQDERVVEGGGLGRRLRIYRLPDANRTTSMQITHDVTDTVATDRDIPVYIRVTQEDGHQAWSSPIYLIKAP